MFYIYRKRIFIATLLLVFAAPLVGYFTASFAINNSLSSPTTNPPTRTKQDIEAAIRRDRADRASTAYPEQSVVKFTKRLDNWYIVETQTKEQSPIRSVLLVGDFYKGTDKLVVMLPPDRVFYRYNIAFESVPLDVIREVNQKRDELYGQ